MELLHPPQKVEQATRRWETKLSKAPHMMTVDIDTVSRPSPRICVVLVRSSSQKYLLECHVCVGVGMLARVLLSSSCRHPNGMLVEAACLCGC